MTIVLSRQAYWDLCEAWQDKAGCLAADPFDQTWQYPPPLGQGYRRILVLPDGSEIAIARYQLHDDLVLRFPSRSHGLEYCFYLGGYQQCNDVDILPGQYALCSLTDTSSSSLPRG